MQETRIEAGYAAKNYWRDLLNSTELLLILAKRDISVRYKQTLLGMGWAILRPFATTMVMVFVFSYIAKLKSDPGVPYPLMVLSGITIWTFFSNTFVQVSGSILYNSNLVTKVYFPRLLMPLSSVVVGLVDFLVAFGLYIAIATWYQYPPTANIIYLPLFIILSLMASLAFGLFFAVINVRFRDVAQLIPFLVQIGFYICPIAYSSSLGKGEWWYKYYTLNPLVGIIDGFRWCLLGEGAFFNPNSLIASVVVVSLFLVFSVYYFKREERSFVDHI